MSEAVLNFIRDFQQGNNTWFIFVLIAFSIIVGIYVIVVLGTRSANKIIYQREMESTKVIFNNIFANISERIAQSADITEEDAVVYVFAGEQNYKVYRELIPIVQNFLDKVLEKTKKIKIISVAGTKLMVKKNIDDLTAIHPSMQILFDEKYKDYVEFYLVKDCRLPYHFFYSPLSESGLAEVPHRELSTPINWMFKNKEQYKIMFRHWFELLKRTYNVDLLFFRGRELYSRNVLTGNESKIEKKENLFFMRSIILKIKTYFQNETLIQCRYHYEKTGLLMRNWNPFSENLFTRENQKILSSI